MASASIVIVFDLVQNGAIGQWLALVNPSLRLFSPSKAVVECESMIVSCKDASFELLSFDLEGSAAWRLHNVGSNNRAWCELFPSHGPQPALVCRGAPSCHAC